MGGGVNDIETVAAMLLDGDPATDIDEVLDWGDIWGLASTRDVATRLVNELGEYAVPVSRAAMNAERATRPEVK